MDVCDCYDYKYLHKGGPFPAVDDICNVDDDSEGTHPDGWNRWDYSSPAYQPIPILEFSNQMMFSTLSTDAYEFTTHFNWSFRFNIAL